MFKTNYFKFGKFNGNYVILLRLRSIFWIFWAIIGSYVSMLSERVNECIDDLFKIEGLSIRQGCIEGVEHKNSPS